MNKTQTIFRLNRTLKGDFFSQLLECFFNVSFLNWSSCKKTVVEEGHLLAEHDNAVQQQQCVAAHDEKHL